MAVPRNDELAAEFYENGRHLSAVVTIQRSARELYDALREFACVPRLVEEVESVARAANSRLSWTGTAGPGDPFRVESDILADEPGRRLAWRSAESEGVPANAGSVTFRELPFSRGTEMRVVMGYIPPQGKTAGRLATAMGREPKVALQIALWRFRQLMETGEIATTRGQPSGRDGIDEQGAKDEQHSR